jgi:hypothetical protein
MAMDREILVRCLPVRDSWWTILILYLASIKRKDKRNFVLDSHHGQQHMCHFCTILSVSLERQCFVVDRMVGLYGRGSSRNTL